MFYSDLSGQMSFLITTGFSFFFLLATRWFKEAEPVPRLLGFSFLAPLLLSILSFTSQKAAISAAFFHSAEPALLLLIVLALVYKPDRGSLNGWVSLQVFVTVSILFTLVSWTELQYLLVVPAVNLSMQILFLLPILYLLRKEQGTRALLFWAVLALTAGHLGSVYFRESPVSYVTPAFRLASGLIFLRFFQAEYMEKLKGVVTEAEKKITRVNRSLDLEVKKRVFEIERINRNLVNISKTDALSKALNKSAILDSIESLIMSKPGSEFSILMFDIDEFKKINDTLGHVEGDKCIKRLSVIAKNNIRDIDLFGRYGGDEFIIVLPETPTQQALQIAERFRKRVDATEGPHFSVSIGVATYPKDGTEVKHLIQAADEGLYNSKSKGRNAVSYRKEL